MTTLILSTGNIMSAAAASHGYSTSKSNQELLRGLRENIEEAQSADPDASWESWTSRSDSSLYIPSIDFSASALSEDRSAYDITIKLFHLHAASADERAAHTRHALALVRQELHIPDADLLIVSYPGVAFDTSSPDCDTSEAESTPSILASWAAGPAAVQKESLVKRLGVAEFNLDRLAAFLQDATVKPAVDQINTKDCCAMSPALLALAKEHGIELLVHSDCSNILPSGTVRELLNNAGGVLQAVQGDIQPKWVVKYTAVVRDRGVVENKGYFALAEVVGA